MRAYEEKRGFHRMATQCPLNYLVDGEPAGRRGLCLNLSAGGVLFTSDKDLPPGTQVEISIIPEKQVVPPLRAKVEVIRAIYNGSSSAYEVAASIRQIRN